MPAGQFASRIPWIGGTLPARVEEADFTHAPASDRDIEIPSIKGTDRIDADWRWRTYYLRSVLMEAAAGRRLAYLQVGRRVQAPRGPLDEGSVAGCGKLRALEQSCRGGQYEHHPSPSLSFGTTTPNGIIDLGRYCGVYGTTFV